MSDSLELPLREPTQALYMPSGVEAKRHPPLRIVLFPVVRRLLPPVTAPQDVATLASRIGLAHTLWNRGDALLLAWHFPMYAHRIVLDESLCSNDSGRGTVRVVA